MGDWAIFNDALKCFTIESVLSPSQYRHVWTMKVFEEECMNNVATSLVKTAVFWDKVDNIMF